MSFVVFIQTLSIIGLSYSILLLVRRGNALQKQIDILFHMQDGLMRHCSRLEERAAQTIVYKE